jgi:PadR family transcriptional regulator PadR
VLATMGPQHAYQIASRLEQVSESLLNLNQGTLYPALVRLEHYGWIKGAWGKTENNREAKYYAITKAGQKALGEETERWRKMAGLVALIHFMRPCPVPRGRKSGYAPVEMTNQLHKKLCHLDRSVAQWRDLRFLSRVFTQTLKPK